MLLALLLLLLNCKENMNSAKWKVREKVNKLRILIVYLKFDKICESKVIHYCTYNQIF